MKKKKTGERVRTNGGFYEKPKTNNAVTILLKKKKTFKL